MPLIVWTKKLSVGIKELDEQHKSFISMINEASAMEDSKLNFKSRFGDLLGRMLDYARYHFSTEENYFKKYDYPYSEEHMAEHLKLLEEAVSFSDRFKKGENVRDEFVMFLKNWLETHLKTHDMKYAAYFKKIGVNDC